MHTLKNTHTLTRTLTHTHTHTHSHAHTHTHTHTHTHKYTHTHTHMRARTHTYTRPRTHAGVVLVGPAYGEHHDEASIIKRTDTDPTWALLACRSIDRYKAIEAKRYDCVRSGHSARCGELLAVVDRTKHCSQIGQNDFFTIKHTLAHTHTITHTVMSIFSMKWDT